MAYEDDATLAFMDLRQTNKGHVLVVPKMHVETIDLLPSAVAAAPRAGLDALALTLRTAVG